MIYLALTDDWELYGNGSGDLEELQCRPMRRLTGILSRHGARVTFFAEIMQQLTFRRLQARHPELKQLADRWDAAVLQSFGQGNDVQMHIHPQWRQATYQQGRWQLHAPWSLLEHPCSQLREMIAEGKAYLERLLRQVDPGYDCVAFRAGTWCIAPSAHSLPTLAELGFQLDSSMVAGLRLNSRTVKFDYRNAEEGFAPYYPEMNDARKISARREPIVCVPVHCLKGHRIKYLLRDLGLLRERWRHNGQAKPAGNNDKRGEMEPAGPVWLGIISKIVNRYVLGETHVCDLAHLNHPLMRSMLQEIRKEAERRGSEAVPVVLVCHTKDLHDTTDLERFLAEAAGAADIRFLTFRELLAKIVDGTFPVRLAHEPNLPTKHAA